MEYSQVAPEEIEDSLNPNYYKVDYLDAFHKLRECNIETTTIRDSAIKLTDGPFGSNLKVDEYQSTGYPLFRVSNIQSLFIDNKDVVYITPKKQQQLSRSATKPLDVLITKAGRIGSAAVVPKYIIDGNITSHLALIRVKEQLDPYFLASYLESKYGVLLSKRASHKSTRPELTIREVGNIPIILPHKSIQIHIGNKIRLAEKCRREGNDLLSEAQFRFSKDIKLGMFKPDCGNSTFIPIECISQRLAPEFYLPKYYDLEKHLIRQKLPVKQVGNLLREHILRVSTPATSNKGNIPCILTSDIDPQRIDKDDPSHWLTDQTFQKHKGDLKKWDVVYTSVGPPVGEAAIILPRHMPIAVGGDVSVIRTSNNLHPGYLSMYLNSIFGQMQNERYARGIRQRRVYPEDISSFLIPELSSETQEYIGYRVIAYQVLNELGKDIIEEAKMDVGKLVDRQLDTHSIMNKEVQPLSWEIIGRKLKVEMEDYA